MCADPGGVPLGAPMPRVSRPAPADPGQRWQEPVPHLPEPRYSQSVERGLAILECFTPERPVLGIADLADELGMSRSTTHRYVFTLTALGHLVQGAHRKYRLGLGVTDLGMSALSSTSLREHARDYLEELSRRAPYALAIAVLDGPELLYVDRIGGTRRGQHLIDLGLDAGSRLPVHCSAMGKLLVANLPASEQRGVIAELTLSRRGPNTITSKSALRHALAQVFEGGLAVGDEELAPGLYEIAAPVRSETQEVLAAVGMQAHSSIISLEQLVEHLGPHLISTADRVSARLGYRRADERGGGRPARELPTGR
jgi:IclR family pca regulon transcriptional regulator